MSGGGQPPDAGDNAAEPVPGTGEGAQTALLAMIRKRRMNAEPDAPELPELPAQPGDTGPA